MQLLRYESGAGLLPSGASRLLQQIVRPGLGHSAQGSGTLLRVPEEFQTGRQQTGPMSRACLRLRCKLDGRI